MQPVSPVSSYPRWCFNTHLIQILTSSLFSWTACHCPVYTTVTMRWNAPILQCYYQCVAHSHPIISPNGLEPIVLFQNLTMFYTFMDFSPLLWAVISVHILLTGKAKWSISIQATCMFYWAFETYLNVHNRLYCTQLTRNDTIKNWHFGGLGYFSLFFRIKNLPKSFSNTTNDSQCIGYLTRYNPGWPSIHPSINPFVYIYVCVYLLF